MDTSILDLKLGTAHTLLMGAQMVRPREVAPAHRHTMGAIRFVVRGPTARQLSSKASPCRWSRAI